MYLYLINFVYDLSFHGFYFTKNNFPNVHSSVSQLRNSALVPQTAMPLIQRIV